MGGYGTIYLFCWPQWDKIIWVLYNLQINILLDFFQVFHRVTGILIEIFHNETKTPLTTKNVLKKHLDFVVHYLSSLKVNFYVKNHQNLFHCFSMKNINS